MSLIKFQLKDTPEYRELLRKMGAGDKEAIEFFKEHISSAVIQCVDEILARKSTGHKDFSGKELYEDDEVALLEQSGNSVYIRKGHITGRTNKMVRVKYEKQHGGFEESTRSPYNVIKTS